MILENLADTSRVWVYQSQTPIAKSAQSEIQVRMTDFVEKWAAHGNQLYGDSTILEDYFLVLAVDEKQAGASGCSIDSSVRFMKQLEQEFGLVLFDRLHVLLENDGTKSIVHFSEIQNHPNSIIYNPLVHTLGDLRTNWKVKVQDFKI